MSLNSSMVKDLTKEDGALTDFFKQSQNPIQHFDTLAYLTDNAAPDLTDLLAPGLKVKPL